MFVEARQAGPTVGVFAGTGFLGVAVQGPTVCAPAAAKGGAKETLADNALHEPAWPAAAVGVRHRRAVLQGHLGGLLITGLAAGTAGLVVVLPGQEGALGAREAGGSAARLCAGRLQVVTGWTAPATDQTVPLLVGDTVTVGAGSAALAPGTGQQEEEGLPGPWGRR